MLTDHAQRFVDPTDDHRAAVARRPRLEWLDELEWRQRIHGICSAPGCHWPIAAWCGGCRAKVCLDHLQEHRNLHAREHTRA